jgi:hypothetical protein
VAAKPPDESSDHDNDKSTYGQENWRVTCEQIPSLVRINAHTPMMVKIRVRDNLITQRGMTLQSEPTQIASIE